MSNDDQILQAAEFIRQGNLVIMPTETVYGIAGDALNPAALNKIFEAKKRPKNHPLIAHISDLNQLEVLSPEWRSALPFAEAFWPGPLTLVLPKSTKVPYELNGGKTTIAVRIPNHQIALSLISASGTPIAAPSANLFTKTSPTNIDHLSQEIKNSVSAILDGGPCQIGIESTVLDLTQETIAILRLGPISARQIQEITKTKISLSTSNLNASPGNHPSHYSPKSKLVLVDAVESDCIGISINQFGNHIIQLPNDPAEYAKHLYAALHQLDSMGAEVIQLEKPPTTPEWDAVWDRISRASF